MNKEMTKPLVSVVMCTYNTEKYIAEAIASILNQTYKNLEFIIWDDGSTDGTKAIVESFKDERIRYFYHENTGLGMALRMACEKATGKYIARMDSDDVSLPCRLEKEIDFLETNPDYVLVSSAVRYIDEKGLELGRTFPCTKNDLLKKSLKESSRIVHPMVMMTSFAYRKAGGYIGIKAFEDQLFWGRLANHGKFANLTEVLGKYRIQSNSISHVANPYLAVLSMYRSKMMADAEVSDLDVMLYNQLYDASKKFQCVKKDVSKSFQKSFDNRIYSLMGGVGLPSV